MAAAARRQVRVLVINRDTLADNSDLLADEPYLTDLSRARAGEVHGYHAGFVCFSASRVRHRPGGPPPVRDRDHLLGLPTNSAKQQREADRGTLMAVRSANFCQ
eukprot:13074979-Heterocapsa_arctica.AAC.1